MDPTRLSEYLREGDDPELRRRRWVIGLSVLGATAGQLVGLYQTGIIKHLPDPPPRGLWGLFDSDRVDASEYAYRPFSSPDAPLMVITYGVTAWLAGAGGPDRPRNAPWLPIAMAAKTLHDAATTVKLAREEGQENRAFCAYCQTATLASFVSAAFALPEAVRATRRPLGRSDPG